MAGTYSKVHIQVVFAVNGRQNLIGMHWKEDLNKYIAGIIKSKGHKSIIVNGMPDHIHAFIGLKPAVAISDLVRDIKNNSSKFINEEKHHNKKTFKQEYLALLEKFEIEFNEKYLFEWINY